MPVTLSALVCSPSQDFCLGLAVPSLALSTPHRVLWPDPRPYWVPSRTCEVMGIKRKGSDKQRSRWGDLGQEVPTVAFTCLSADPGLTHPLRPLSRRLSRFPRPQPSLLSEEEFQESQE